MSKTVRLRCKLRRGLERLEVSRRSVQIGWTTVVRDIQLPVEGVDVGLTELRSAVSNRRRA